MNLVCRRPSTADTARLTLTVGSADLAVALNRVGPGHEHRAGRTERHATRLVPVTQHVSGTAGAAVHEDVGAEAERRLEPIADVLRPPAERHPGRELRLPGVQHLRRPRLRHTGQTKRQAQLVSILDRQRAMLWEAELLPEVRPNNAGVQRPVSTSLQQL